MEPLSFEEKRQNLQKRRLRQTLGQSIANGFSDIESGSTVSQPIVCITMYILYIVLY